MSDGLARITTAKIYPAIGIARVGNSPPAFLIGPERVGESRSPKGGYKDGQDRMKRQAARFRIFRYDEGGRLIQEITRKDATITWTVHLANKKAARKEFDRLNRNMPLRNGTTKDRASLVIDPGPRTLVGPRQSASFDTGTFMGNRVPLGGMRTDSDGRLLVLGGFGHSASPKRTAAGRGRFAVLLTLVLLTIGSWSLTVYQARSMDVPMGVAARGGVSAMPWET